jgi:mRNA interferase MazF
MSPIKQGDVFWVDFGVPSGSAPGYRRPAVIIQNNLFNQSRINTVVACAITSNLRRANAPGNVPLEKGEAGLPERSVVAVSQIITVDKQGLNQKIGTLSLRRVRQILEGVRLVTEPSE